MSSEEDTDIERHPLDAALNVVGAGLGILRHCLLCFHFFLVTQDRLQSPQVSVTHDAAEDSEILVSYKKTGRSWG